MDATDLGEGQGVRTISRVGWTRPDVATIAELKMLMP
jgi:hypothetical protein